MSKRLPTLELDPVILTRPSIRASKLSNCSGVSDNSPPSIITKVSPEGKLVVPYVVTIFDISAAVPETISSTLFKFWNAVPLIE